MNYTLNQLRIFLKIAQTQSVTKAAEELHLTQPAVSMQLKKFQDQFDIPLTETIGRNIFTTTFGDEIAVAAEKILQQVYDINYKMHTYRGQIVGRLKISVVSTGKYVIPYFLSSFIKQNTGVDLVLDVTNKGKVIESLEANDVDFALVSIPPANLKVEKIDLISNKLYLVGNTDTTFKKKSYNAEIFKTLPLIFREKGSGTREAMNKFFKSQNITVLKKMELTSNEAVKQAVIAGLGYSVMPLIGIKNELQNKQLTIIPVKGLPIQTTWSLIWLKGKEHTNVANASLSYIKEHKEGIIAEHFKWYEEYK